jgi:hypothetical protein
VNSDPRQSLPCSQAGALNPRLSANMKIIQALKIVFGKDKGINLSYIFLFLLFAIAFIFFFIELQVLLTPEPDNLSLYLKIWQIRDWLIVGLLSILVSLNFVFFVYLVTHTNSTRIKNESDTNKFIKNSLPFVDNSHNIRCKFVYYPAGILGTLSGIFSAILATAFCSSCLAVLFSLLGISFSTGIFFLKYKFLIFLLSTILLLISLHFQSKRIVEKCKCWNFCYN